MLGNLKHYYRAMRVKAAGQGGMNAPETPTPRPIPPEPAEIRKVLEETFGNSGDLVCKLMDGDAVLLAYIDGMVDKPALDTHVIRPLMLAYPSVSAEQLRNTGYLMQNLLTASELRPTADFNECIDCMMAGAAVLYVRGGAEALRISLQKWNGRQVDEPKAESVIRGSREGFNENIHDNIVLIRRRVQDSNLTFESMRVGRQSKTQVAICYVRGVANEEIISEVRKRLRNIKTDVVLESAYIEEFIEDAPFSIFATVGHTERPDAVAGKILDGRVAVLCDGTPFVLTVPFLFVEHLQTTEDYNNRWLYSALLRFIRLLSLVISGMTPAFYVTFLCFHQDVIPFRLLLTISAASEGVPFPPMFECLILIFIYEFIREGGIRMPKSLGQAISIVGALIIGQVAVQAGIVSSPAVIVIAATAISTFIVPALDDSMLIVRLLLLFIAGSLGFLGITLGFFALFAYMCSLRSFGVPFLSPLAPHFGQDLKDVFIRMPFWTLLQKSESVTRRYVDGGAAGGR